MGHACGKLEAGMRLSAIIDGMHPVEALRLVGGLSNRGTLLRYCTRREVQAAMDSGLIVRSARDRYALPGVEDARRLAHATRGVLCLASAALEHGWEVKEVPRRPQICYPKDRRLSREIRSQVDVHWADLDPAEIDGLATSKHKTLEMCARNLPYDEGLAIADSAVRNGERATLTSLRHARGPGARRVKRVVADADGRAANPFESTLRAIAMDVSGLNVVPQVPVLGYEPDLVDVDLRIIAEADSFEWHGKRRALHRDASRYNDLVAHDWLVLRFSWEAVMGEPEVVRQRLAQVVALRTRQRT